MAGGPPCQKHSGSIDISVDGGVLSAPIVEDNDIQGLKYNFTYTGPLPSKGLGSAQPERNNAGGLTFTQTGGVSNQPVVRRNKSTQPVELTTHINTSEQHSRSDGPTEAVTTEETGQPAAQNILNEAMEWNGCLR